jgi:hypothetical protein
MTAPPGNESTLGREVLRKVTWRIIPLIAHCCSQLVASLLDGDDVNGRVLVRAIRYTDRLRRVDGRWLIYERLHEPLWQYDAVSQPLHLLGPSELKAEGGQVQSPSTRNRVIGISKSR